MSEFTVDLDVQSMIEAATPNHTIVAPGALDGMVGKTVPVTVGEGESKTTVGEAELFKDSDGNVMASVRFVL